MKKLSENTIKTIICEYQKGDSLRYITKKHDIGLGSVHKYITEAGIIRKHNIIEKILTKDEQIIGLYIGLWMGDGTQYPDKGYRIKICGNKRDLLLNKFIQDNIYTLFGKKTRLYTVSSTNQAYIIYKSKFIYNYIYNYISQENKQKTYTVRLKRNVNLYSKKFLEGCLLGLILSDGYLKNKFCFNVISKRLSKNMTDILTLLGYHPKIYTHRRKIYGWKDLQMVTLNVEESHKLNLFLDKVLKELKCAYSFQELKYEPAEIRTPDLMMAEYHPIE